MLIRKKEELNIDKFWKDYEDKIGEKVLSKSLGRYLGGWDEYPEILWGLAIATSGGFRFHHFPHEGWLVALSRITTGGEPPKEKTFFIPREKIILPELILERRWWKKLLTPSAPVLRIAYSRPDGTEARVQIETDRQAAETLEALRNITADNSGH
jgi:hypothetical protein